MLGYFVRCVQRTSHEWTVLSVFFFFLLLLAAGVAPEGEGEGGGVRQSRLEGVRRRQRHPRPSIVDGKHGCGRRVGVVSLPVSAITAAVLFFFAKPSFHSYHSYQRVSGLGYSCGWRF